MGSLWGRRPLGLLASLGLVAGLALVAPEARADSVQLIDVSATVFGSATNTYSFQAPGPGTVWVSLSDVKWPEQFQSLTTSILNSHDTLQQIQGASMFDVQVSQAGMLYAAIAGIAGNTLGLNVGMYSLHVGFTPAGEPVPLPEAFRLLLLGLGLMGTILLLWKRPQAGWSVLEPQAGAMKA